MNEIAEYHDMATFWTWWVRNPSALLAALAAATGFAAIADWSIALTGALVFALIADVGHHLGSKARERAVKSTAATEALREARVLRERLARPASSRETRRPAA